jgi:hypothetical protein
VRIIAFPPRVRIYTSPLPRQQHTKGTGPEPQTSTTPPPLPSDLFLASTLARPSRLCCIIDGELPPSLWRSFEVALLICNFQSRSLRQHQQHQMRGQAPDGFPTPPSSASTPPAIATTSSPAPSGVRMSPPPRKKLKLDVDHSLSNGEAPGEITTDSQTDGSISKIRIRLKYSMPKESRKSPRFAESRTSREIGEMSGPRMDVGQADTTDQEMTVEKPVEWQVCEMVEQSENWRVIGLNNVGNTCFTNAILQIFSYPNPFWFILLTWAGKRRCWGNTLCRDIPIVRRR